MGAGKKVAIGCGGLMVLMGIAGFLGFKYVKSNFAITMDPVEVVRRTKSMTTVQIPVEFVPAFSVYTETSKRDPMVLYYAEGSRTQETSLTIYQRTGSFTEEELFAEITADGGTAMEIDIGVEELGEAEHFSVQYLDDEYQATLMEGLDEETLVNRVVMVTIPQDETTLLFVLTGDPVIIHRDLLQEILSTASVETELEQVGD